MATLFNIPFGTIDFFTKHDFIFLICIAFFPRLTLLFSSVASGGLVWWLSWLFFPRLLVAVLATFAYFQTNPILVTISWLVALSGETFEKRTLPRGRIHINTFYSGASPTREREATPLDEDIIDADFKRLK